jgi:histone arginine demethylase JMJD6
MKIAEDDEGNKIKMDIKSYYKYLAHQRDDSPLYMFQSGFEELEGTQDIIKNYSVPKYFREDYFRYVSRLLTQIGEAKRPPYRWFLIGPKRSGSTIHIDPIGTSAWNTSVQGHKLWVMFAPEYPKWIINGKNHRSNCS